MNRGYKDFILFLSILWIVTVALDIVYMILLYRPYFGDLSHVPFPFFIDPLSYTLIEQVLSGPLLRDVDPIDIGLMKKVGFEVAKLHLSGVVHGDLTTSNVIVSSGTDPFIIDFGLGAFSADLEDRGVDLLLLKKSLEANLPDQSHDLFSSFYEGYKEILGADAAQILARSQEIERRGRYFAERSFD